MPRRLLAAAHEEQLVATVKEDAWTASHRLATQKMDQSSAMINSVEVAPQRPIHTEAEEDEANKLGALLAAAAVAAATEAIESAVLTSSAAEITAHLPAGTQDLATAANQASAEPASSPLGAGAWGAKAAAFLEEMEVAERAERERSARRKAAARFVAEPNAVDSTE